MSDRLRDLAELSQPNAKCDCGHSARRHFVFRYCGACGCSRIRAAEVEAEYARLVAVEVTHVLTVDREPEALDFITKLGFTGLAYNRMLFTSSRYASGKTRRPQDDRSPLRGILFRVMLEDAHARPLHVPEFHRAADLSWGAERTRLREYLRSRIIPPPIASEHTAVLNRYLPLMQGRIRVENANPLLTAGVLGTLWSFTPVVDVLPLVRIAETIPPHLLPPCARQ